MSTFSTSPIAFGLLPQHILIKKGCVTMLAYYKNEEFNTATHRPYKSPDGRYICTFEGSLVNQQKLRQKLEKTGIYTSSTCPEELILNLYHFCGDSLTEVLRGKFAIIIFDKKLRQLIAARDRYGVRPLYYKLVASGIEITSELVNFKPSRGCPLSELNYGSLRHYFSYGYIPENETYLKNVYHLPAGCFLKYSNNGLAITPFADMLAIEGSKDQLVGEQLLRDVVTEGIHSRLPAEKKIGVFYTGKASELVIATTAKQASSEVKMFSVEFSRRQPTSKVLKELLTCFRINADDYWRAAENAISVMDVPIADPTAPIDFLSGELASKYVDVVVSADGAEILFGTDEQGIKRLKRKKDGLIFTEAEKEQLLKFTGNPWSEIVAPYIAQTSDLDRISRWQTLELNMQIKGSTVLKKERLASYHDLDLRFPFFDDKVLDVASFLTSEEKKSMLLFKQTFAGQISKFQKSKKVDLQKILDPHKIPLAKWIRTDLYEQIKSIFEQDIAEEFFNTDVLLKMLEQHRKGLRELSYQIWAITMFIIWVLEVRSQRSD